MTGHIGRDTNVCQARFGYSALRETQYSVTLNPMISRESLGEALRRLRVEKKLDLEDVVTDASSLSRIERGEQGYSHESLGQIADALGTPLSQIYALAEAIQNGTTTPETVRLVLTMESLPEKPRGSIQEIVDTVAKSIAPWDGVGRRRTDSPVGRLLNRAS
jgi:transcriptional regulator with XRE-family HTH domain